MTAVIRALESLTRACEVDLYTDSQYVKNGIETWIHGWRKNGWKTSDKKPVKNADLWHELDAAVARHDIRWHWVKGHADDPGQRTRRCACQSRRPRGDRAAWRTAIPAHAGARSIRRANTVISFSACLSPRAGRRRCPRATRRALRRGVRRGERLAVELPRGRVFRVLRDGSREVLRRARRLVGLQVFVAERVAQQRASPCPPQAFFRSSRAREFVVGIGTAQLADERRPMRNRSGASGRSPGGRRRSPCPRPARRASRPFARR